MLRWEEDQTAMTLPLGTNTVKQREFITCNRRTAGRRHVVAAADTGAIIRRPPFSRDDISHDSEALDTAARAARTAAYTCRRPSHPGSGATRHAAEPRVRLR